MSKHLKRGKERTFSYDDVPQEVLEAWAWTAGGQKGKPVLLGKTIYDKVAATMKKYPKYFEDANT